MPTVLFRKRSFRRLYTVAKCRLSIESHEDSLPTTTFSSGPQDYKELYIKLTATQRQLIRAREVIQKKEGAMLGIKVNLKAIFPGDIFKFV